MVLHTLHLPHDLHASWFQSHLTAEERERVISLIEQRIEERVPLPYLTGEAWFAGLKFFVDPHVLIPRSPIAELIEQGFAPWLDPDRVGRVLDLCCGSGCIGIASALYLPDCRVDLVDLSDDALAVCRKNVDLHGLSGRVGVVQSDLFADLEAVRYDLIVSNPPYVGAEEMADLPAEYRHEPAMALEAADDGLEIVLRILREAAKFLAPDGVLIVELGNSAHLLQERYPEIPFIWLDFAKGGDGVFLLQAKDLAKYAQIFSQSVESSRERCESQ